MKNHENFSKIAKSLTKLTKKEEPFEWIIKQQTAFNLLKNKLIIRITVFRFYTRISCDASDYAIEAIIYYLKES